ncbi:hypothetical protein D5R81_12385 [Parashewanella spongiae]|uniref:Uncharacterized protein n=1 Tax=Parashewanella spongiae TaxID=342950 RepID=A0A3A6U434_9GAMM|nr:hypothetical protein [Parashewanella spongiae]MCL1076666.1 hypothetical protein [Parashewanella spongiae]RJY12408.1 hypothetical protein D5R81_12385 [Parashewanella spongiae]
MAVILGDEVRFSLKGEHKKLRENQLSIKGTSQSAFVPHHQSPHLTDIFYKKQQKQASEYLYLFENTHWQICNELAEVHQRIGIFNWLKYQCKMKHRPHLNLNISMNANRQFVCRLQFKQDCQKSNDLSIELNESIESKATLILDIKREIKFVFKVGNLAVTRLPQPTFHDQKNRYFDFLFSHYRLLLGCKIMDAATEFETRWNQAVEVCIVNLVNRATQQLAGTNGFSQFPSIMEIESSFAESIIAKALELVF